MLRNRRRISATNYRFAANVAASDDCSTRNSLPITRRLDCVSGSQLRAIDWIIGHAVDWICRRCIAAWNPFNSSSK